MLFNIITFHFYVSVMYFFVFSFYGHLVKLNVRSFLRKCVSVYLSILGFIVAFNTVQVISRRVVGRAAETNTYSLSRFCTVNC